MALTTSAVTEAAFAEHRQRDWSELEALTRTFSDRGVRKLSAIEVARVPPLYRDVCADLARAQAARYSAPLVLSPPASSDELASLPSDVSLDADERLAIELFLRRRHRLGRARELELANMIASPLSRRFGFRGKDPSRTLALLYDRAANAGRDEAPVSSRGAVSWR